MQVKSKKIEKRRKIRMRFSGVGEAAQMAGVSECHVRHVLKGERLGSEKVWNAIEATRIRDALTGKLMKRPRK